MAARCTNGHDTPSGSACMYCGAPIVAPTPVPAAYAPTPTPGPPSPPPPSGPSVLRILVIIAVVLVGLAVAVTVLAAIVVFARGGLVDTSESSTTTTTSRPTPSSASPSACRTEARTLLTASEAFKAQTNTYPKTMDELVYAHMILEPSALYDLRANENALPDLVPIDGACGGVTVRGG